MSTPRASPIERYLGAPATSMGPVGLLGLTPETCDDDRIVAALEQQLDRVAQHPEADTPEADEVRLALHSAAAQLLDTNVRRHIMDRLAGGVSPAAAAAAAAGEPVSGSIEQDAILTLAMYGGWNQRSLERLAALAHARGMSSGELAQALRGLTSGKRSPGRPTPPPAPAPAPPRTPPYASHGPTGSVPSAGEPRGVPAAAPAPEGDLYTLERDQGAVYVKNILLGIGVVFVTLVALLVVLLMVFTGGRSRAPGAAPGGTGGAVAVAPPPTPVSPPNSTPNSKPAPTPGAGPATAPAPGPGSAPAGAPAPRGGGTSPPRAAARSVPKAGDPGYIDPLLIVRSLRESVGLLRTDRDAALKAFTSGVRALERRWCRFDPAQRRAADSAVVDFLYAAARDHAAAQDALRVLTRGAEAAAGSGFFPASSGEAGEGDGAGTGAAEADAAAPDAAGSPRDSVQPAVWSIGVLTRISREKELPADVMSRVEAVLTASIGADRPRLDAGFENGAAAALRRLPARIVRSMDELAPKRPAGAPPAGAPPADDAAPLTEWIDAVAATAGADVDLRERLLADGLERVMAESREPREDRYVFAAIQQLTVEIKWRAGGSARARLLDWFSDDRISDSDLQTLTSALASQSSAEGVDPMMVLSIGATRADRERLRGAYVKAWGQGGSVGRKEQGGALAQAAAAEFERFASLSSPAEMLEAAVRASELSDAAGRLWKGDAEAAGTIIEGAASAATSGSGPVRMNARIDRNSEGDGRWLASYLSAGRSIPLRLERLKQIESGDVEPGPADAELLVELACNESPVEVRAAAQRAVLKYSEEPMVVNGLLETLPRAPKYFTVSNMIERVVHRPLPRASDPAWELEARRALVERLLELLAQSGDQAAMESLAGVLWESYRARSSQTPRDRSATTSIDPSVGLEAAASMWRRLRDDAEAVSPNDYAPVSIEVIERRREGRLVLAVGPIQRFCAEQTGAVELMAYVVTGERPSAAAAARKVLDDLAASRRRAGHIFEQIAATEQAMLRLWLIRLQEKTP